MTTNQDKIREFNDKVESIIFDAIHNEEGLALPENTYQARELLNSLYADIFEEMIGEDEVWKNKDSYDRKRDKYVRNNYKHKLRQHIKEFRDG